MILRLASSLRNTDDKQHQTASISTGYSNRVTMQWEHLKWCLRTAPSLDIEIPKPSPTVSAASRAAVLWAPIQGTCLPKCEKSQQAWKWELLILLHLRSQWFHCETSVHIYPLISEELFSCQWRWQAICPTKQYQQAAKYHGCEKFLPDEPRNTSTIWCCIILSRLCLQALSISSPSSYIAQDLLNLFVISSVAHARTENMGNKKQGTSKTSEDLILFSCCLVKLGLASPGQCKEQRSP